MKIYVLALILCSIAPILSAQENEGPDSCVKHKKICGLTSSNPPTNHGECCAGLKCHQPRLGSSGRCVSEGDFIQYLIYYYCLDVKKVLKVFTLC